MGVPNPEIFFISFYSIIRQFKNTISFTPSYSEASYLRLRFPTEPILLLKLLSHW